MADTTTVDLNAVLAELLLTPEGRADPYPRYAVVREHAPAFRSALDITVVSRYDDCQWVLRDPRFGKGTDRPWERHGMTKAEWLERFPSFQPFRRALLNLDPPDHARVDEDAARRVACRAAVQP